MNDKIEAQQAESGTEATAKAPYANPKLEHLGLLRTLTQFYF